MYTFVSNPIFDFISGYRRTLNKTLFGPWRSSELVQQKRKYEQNSPTPAKEEITIFVHGIVFYYVPIYPDFQIALSSKIFPHLDGPAVHQIPYNMKRSRILHEYI